MQIIEREHIDDEEDLFEAIVTSQAGDVRKLQETGIYTCNGLMMQNNKHLTGIKGLSEAKVDKICVAAEKLVNFGYITGSDVLLRRKSVIRVTTGSQALDELLGGGIETSCITEAFGEFRSGKTQLAHTLCVSTQLPINMRGGNGKVAYIDTEGTFRPDRIVPIAERFGMDAGAVLDNIIYARAYTYEHQYNLLLGLAAKMAEEPFRLLIVDSIIALFRVDFTGRGELAERQQKLAQMLSRLTKIAEEFNVAVYMTNQVIADPGGGMFISDPKKPAGGHVLAHAATIRLMFRKGKGEQRVCKLFDTTNLPAAEAIFQITPGGIADAGIKGLSEAKVDKICEAAKKLVNFDYVTGSDVLLKRKSDILVTRGSQSGCVTPGTDSSDMDVGAVLDRACFAAIGLANPPRPIGGGPMLPPWWWIWGPQVEAKAKSCLYVGFQPIQYPRLSCGFKEPLKPVVQD